MTNLYGVLGVRPDATREALRSAYRKLAQVHHPDRNGGQDARFKEIAAAYEVLSDEAQRTEYDRHRTEWLRERGAMACPGCGLGVRILPQRPGQEARCPECKAPLPTLPAEPERIEVMDVFVERLRVTGHRLGSQVLSETAAVAEELSSDMMAEATALAETAVRVGFERLRTKLGLPMEARGRVVNGRAVRRDLAKKD